MKPIVLASGSPRRKQLLEMLCIPFRVIPPDVDEHVLPGEKPDAYVTRLSRAKAQAVVARAPGDASSLPSTPGVTALSYHFRRDSNAAGPGRARSAPT